MAEEREQWGTRAGFLLAAIGSAVGLGNIWRFPYVAYDNGGGAFLVPYLVALLTAGIPLLVLEYALGHRFRGSAPLTFRRLHPRAEFLGWWQVGVCFLIASYYAVVIAWAAAYTWFSFDLSWGDDPEAFLFEDYLGATGPWDLGGIRPGVMIPLVLVWVVTLGVLLGGVRRGVERANRVLIPLLTLTFAVLVVRALTLEGATAGLDALFSPDWSALSDGSVWVAAYGQIFFSLSVGFAIMITYASYLPRKGADLTTNGFIAGFANSSFELLAGIGVFAALGFLAASQGAAVEDVAAGGVGLAFVVFPTIVSELPALNRAFGVLFFASLVAAGLSSLISITEAGASAVMDKFGWTRRRAVGILGGITALVSLLYGTGLGVTLLDTVDNFVNSFGVAVVGLVEVIVVAWALRRLGELRRHADGVSDLPLGRWWTVALIGVTPVLLGAVTLDNLRRELTEPYEGLPIDFLVIVGWGAAALALVFGLVLTSRPWHADATRDFEPEPIP
ncbi:sodium-dependent transporter [Egicoccus halophilus]|uniref:Transporter n=1 Tax=Egicoccus halophilus TaxID=1670830 RepID=A0A8J3A6Q8_9ACTN|nr:sodium-dependent transporter [Egicoccus halophilus]GGI04615.1 transporter [Egicoccus halophilus]